MTMGSQGPSTSTHHCLPRQGSLYNLTLDEVENQLGNLGKPLSSMNLDELLKNVWSAEASNQITDTHNPDQLPLATAGPLTLQRQTSLALCNTLSKKTVDEVWRDIQQGKNNRNNQINEKERVKDRQTTLGEMTLEDFLVKAGVVAEGSADNNAMISPSTQQNYSQQPQWLQYQPQQHMMGLYMPGHQAAQALPIVANPHAYPDNQMDVSSPLMATSSDTQTPRRKRGASGDMVEKTVERRQKRMIKNRESAARSRARKQAYTNELENKVSRLEEENEKLKKLKKLETSFATAPLPEPKHQLRRTSSARF